MKLNSLLLILLMSFVWACNSKHNGLDDPNATETVKKADLDKLNEKFYLGSHLAREPMPPMKEMKHDMEILKKNGFNLVKLQEHWAVDEPEEGQYDFSKYEELIAHAKSLDMYVYLGLTCEQAPAWLFEKYPDCRMVGRNGLPIIHEAQSPMPADGKPGPCFDHPGAKAAQEGFIRKLVETLGKYDNVLVWNTWQEVGYWSERLVGQEVCYCDHTFQAYHQWLEKKYGTLEVLNSEWKTNYAKWEYIKPNRNYKQKFTLPQDISWSYFQENIKITSVLENRAEIIRNSDELNRPVFCHLGDWCYGSGRDWKYARSSDFLGSSSYPASNWGEFNEWDDVNIRPNGIPDKYESLLDEMWRMLALRFDYLHSCNPPGNPLWAAEFQGGPVSTGFHKGRVPSANDIRRWMYTVIGSGVNTISFWVTRAEIVAAETNGFSLLDSEGDETPRFLEAGRIGQALIKHQDLFSQPSIAKARVGIFVNEENHQFCANMLNGGDHLEFSTRGWHRLLWESGIPLDFIEASVLAETDISEYNAIIMPFPISISDSLMAVFDKYVLEGGNLISEAGIARFNENAYSNRGEISKSAGDLFGVKQKSFTMVREPSGGQRWTMWERTWGEYLDAAILEGGADLKGYGTMANVYIQTYEPINSKPCLFYRDEVAGTVRKHGKGNAWLFGTYIGHNGTAYRNEHTNNFVKALMEKCGVLPEHKGELLLRRRSVDGKKAIIITNPTDHLVTEQIYVGDGVVTSDLFDKPVKNENQEIRMSLESLQVEIILVHKQVKDRE